MSALPNPTPAAPRRSLFPERITAGRAQTAADLRRHAAHVDRTARILDQIERLDAATSPDAPPTSGAARQLANLAERYVERACLARALRALAGLHDACDVPAPLFTVRTARHVSALLAPHPATTGALDSALGWTAGTRRADAVREMAALLERLGVARPFPLPAAVARNLSRPPQPTPEPAASALTAYEAWTEAVDAEALRFGLAGAVAHFASLPWDEAFRAGIEPRRAAAVVRAWIVGCDVHGACPFAWSPPPFDPGPDSPSPAAPSDPEDPGDDTPAAPDGEGETLAPPNPTTAERLGAQADRLAAEIHTQRNLHEGQTLTPRRARIRAAGQRQADALEPTLTALHALALAMRTGTLPVVLARVTTRAAVEELVASDPGTVPVYPDEDNDLRHRERRGRLRRAGIRDSDDFAAAVEALASLVGPPDDRDEAARDAARIRSLVESARLAGIPDYFFSPPAVTDAILDAAGLPHDAGPDFRILDPSAGDGAILDAARARLPHATFDAAEVNSRLREILAAKGYVPVGRDALSVTRDPGFDRVLMNPPDTAGEVEPGPSRDPRVRYGPRLHAAMLQPHTPGPVPEDTARIARAAFPKGAPLITLRDEIGTVFSDDDFAALYPDRGQPAYSPWRLALVTVLQFREDLSDRKAADAVRARIDWKYLLGLPLDDAGFDASVLCEFRARLVDGGAEQVLLDRVLDACRDRGLLRKRGRQRTDATHVVANIREMNRLELASETVRAALNALAAEAPEWVRALAQPDWFKHYSRRVEDTRLPKSQAGRAARTVDVGTDGYTVLDAVDAGDAPPGLATLPVIDALRRVWGRHYERDADAGVQARELRGRGPDKGDSVESPYDTDARFRRKRATGWTGYMAHLTETCDEDLPRLVIHADTTPADVHEAMRTGPILASLDARGLSASEHLVDAGYVSGEHLVAAQHKHGVRLVGPTRINVRWQGQVDGGYTVDRFEIDWERKVVTCPEGHENLWWNAFERGDGRPSISVRFARADCGPCPAQSLCVRSDTRGRSMQLSPQAEHEAREAMRAELDSAEGRAGYAARSGIEGTISQGVRSAGLRRTRYQGLAKTRLGHIATAAGLSVDRAAAWLGGRPVAQTRTSRFAALAA